MIVLILFIGVILVVAAIRNTQGTLFSALQTDVPGFFIWGAAVLAVAAIGYVPGLKTASRGLLALIVVVLVLNNYQAILAGFSGATKTAAPTTGGATSQPSLAVLNSLVTSASAGTSSFSSGEAAA